MASSFRQTLGIPTAGAFDAFASKDEAGRPLGPYVGGHWQVPRTINQVETTDGAPWRCYRERPQSYDAMIRRSAARFPRNEAVVCGTRRVTWSELDEMIERAAYGYVEAGFCPGDRACVMLDNRLEYLVAMLAAIRAGGIAIPLGTRLGPADVEHVLRDAGPKLVVTAQDWVGSFNGHIAEDRIFLVDAAPSGPQAFARLQSASATTLPQLSSDDVAMIIYTSGTTGKPKGACLTHTNFVHTCLHYLYALAIDRPLRSLLAVPGTHIAGFGPLASVTLASGGTIVMCQQFRPAEALELIQREKITYAVLVPAMYQLLVMKAPVEQFELTSWIYGVYGGAIMPPATIQRFSEVAPHLRMINAYGATETCAVCTIMPPELTFSHPASVGLPLECDDVMIVDAEGSPVPTGQTGELWIRGPNVSPGYWNNPSATEREFYQGYWKSGDVGYRDAQGLVYINDRLKDMINRGGFKVFSAEVENALMGHPEVADCAVVGVPDSVLGEKTYAMVTTTTNTLDGVSLAAFLKARIADYKVPDFWDIGAAPVPRNQNGKVQKADVRMRARASQASVPG
jgi:long-chain acyl-CoA synthetase